MDHAAAEDLQPVVALADHELVLAAPAADIHLGRWLGEREERRAEADAQIVALEIRTDEIAQAALQVAHMRGAVDHQALDLMEHRRVRHVAVAAIGAAVADQPERRFPGLHRPDLYRAGMGAQQQRLSVLLRLQEEGVVHQPRRVLGREIQRREVVEVVLDIRPFGDREAHVGEDGHDLVRHLAHRMDPALGAVAQRQRDVDPLGGEPGIERLGLQLGRTRFERSLDLALQRIERLARLAALLRRQRAEGLGQLGDAPLLAEGGDTHLVQRRQIRSSTQLGQDLVAQDARYRRSSPFILGR